MTKTIRPPSTLSAFLHYVSLNMLAMLGTSCYILADTFFVANGIGEDGLTALNLVLPLFNLFCQQSSVGKQLEVAVRMFLHGFQQTFIHQRLSSQYPEKIRTLSFTFGYNTIQLGYREGFPATGRDPTTATTQITTLRDGYHHECGEKRSA